MVKRGAWGKSVVTKHTEVFRSLDSVVAPCLHHVIISRHSEMIWLLNEWDLLLLLSYFTVILHFTSSSRECYTQSTKNDWFYLIYFPALCENQNFKSTVFRVLHHLLHPLSINKEILSDFCLRECNSDRLAGLKTAYER